MNDNVIQFPDREQRIEMAQFEAHLEEHDKLVDSVTTMIDVHAHGIITSSDEVDWGHMMEAMLHLSYLCGIRSGMDEDTVNDLIQTSRVIEVEFDE